MSSLIIVESPTKAKTLKKPIKSALGDDFEILASYGHVRDLQPKKGAVDPEHQFAMRYELIERNIKHLDPIIKAAKKASTIYMATDPDREGEAISWHICEVLKQKKLLSKKTIHRVVFHEITQTAITHAFEHPRELSMDLVNAQQARRALDYLVGFNLSPLLWKKVRRGLSAGRVQSPALRMIVEREEEIEKFETQEYWTIEAEALQKKQSFSAKLIEFTGEKLTQFSITQNDQAENAKTILLKAANGYLEVVDVVKKKRKRNPAAPFTTSTLQQDAIRKLGFTSKRAMQIAQQLYEGVDIGQGPIGLITYMRTDSVNLANEAVNEIREFIAKRYSASDLPAKPPQYRTKSKNAQEAHEAIRPTSAFIEPEAIKGHLTNEQFKLYELIWKRTIACQMNAATINTVSVDLAAGEGNRFRATGSTVADPAFMQVYQESIDEHKKDDDEHRVLPPMTKGDKVKLKEITCLQHFTEPPPRYTEASLVKTLEEHGIGRPSTYATIIATLLQRAYVVLQQKRFTPTDVGRVVNRFLTQYFNQYVDYDFTAKLEDELDAVSRGEKEWIPLLNDFWTPFKMKVADTEANVQRKDVTQEKIDENCPECGKPLSIRLGRRGRFIGCTGYPECTYTRNLTEESGEAPDSQAATIDHKCPLCEHDLVIKHGPYGKFIGCSQYPNCKHIEPMEKPADTGVACPECKEGSLLKRRSRRGTYFYSCSTYPSCKYATWNEPLDEACPKCQWPILTLKITKTKGTSKACPVKGCGYTEKVDSE
jgi:DNA topoisomerase I